MASFGAAHIPDGLFLGVAVDTEPNGQPHPVALGDDILGIDDEDGVVFASPMIGGTSCTVIVMSSAPGFLDAWIDFDGDGSWAQPSNRIATLVPLIPGPNVIVVPVPAVGAPLNTFARFRASHSGTSWWGFANGGEVEDYQVSIGCRIQATASVTLSPLTLVLNWPATGGASYYTVYGSTTLASPFPAAWTLETPVPPGVAGLTWSQAITVPKKFYQVVAWP